MRMTQTWYSTAEPWWASTSHVLLLSSFLPPHLPLYPPPHSTPRPAIFSTIVCGFLKEFSHVFLSFTEGETLVSCRIFTYVFSSCHIFTYIFSFPFLKKYTPKKSIFQQWVNSKKPGAWFGKDGGWELGSFSSGKDLNRGHTSGVAPTSRSISAWSGRSDSYGREGHKSFPSCEDKGIQSLPSQR